MMYSWGADLENVFSVFFKVKNKSAESNGIIMYTVTARESYLNNNWNIQQRWSTGVLSKKLVAKVHMEIHIIMMTSMNIFHMRFRNQKDYGIYQDTWTKKIWFLNLEWHQSGQWKCRNIYTDVFFFVFYYTVPLVGYDPKISLNNYTKSVFVRKLY